MTDFTAKLNARLIACDAEIDRVKGASLKTIQELQDAKAVLTKAKLLLAANPDAEALIGQLRDLGAL